MVTRVLDTSVGAKWFFQEEGTDRALALLRELLERSSRVQVPSSFSYELANVLSTRRSAAFSEREAREVWAELETFPITIVDGAGLLPEAIPFAFEHGLTVYDAVFVVLARWAGCELITADRVLWETVAGDCPWVKRL